MTEPTRRRLPPRGNPYHVDPETKQIFKIYMVGLTLANGTEKWFSSDEHADAFLAGRKPRWQPGMS
jgi:hypothetical protein